MVKKLATSSVLLYPQRVWPETFGLVLAEAAAVGTPTLAYDFGAAREVMPLENPPYRCKTTEEWLTALDNVLKLKLTPYNKYTIEKIAKQWETYLGDL